MRNNRKTLGIFLILLGILIIILIIILAFSKKDKNIDTPVNDNTVIQSESTEIETGSTTPSDVPRNYQQYDISKEPEHKFNSGDLSKVAKSFTERFGSYTNQSNYDNFTDLKIFMTADFSKWVDNYVETLQSSKSDSNSYYGIATRALSSEVVSFDDKKGEAQVIVSTERNETLSSGENDPYYQDLTLDFVKEKNDWLVDATYWEK